MKQSCSVKLAIAIAMALGSIHVMAEDAFPSRPIKIIVPYAPGGLPDTVARVISEQMQLDLKQSVIVDNKPGGGGSSAVTVLKQAPADGYALLITDGPLLAVSPIIIANISYDVAKDLDPVSLIGVAPLFLAANSSVPFNNMREFIDYAKKNPGKLNYGSSGIGSIHHLTAEAMNHALGIQVGHVPYKGSSASVPAMIGNQVDVTFASPPSLMGFVKNGRAKILATNTLERSQLEPNVPAISEYAKGFDFGFTVVAMARKGTPESIRLRLSDSIKKAIADPATKEKLIKAGVESIAGGPKELDEAFKAETRRVVQAAKLADLKPN